MPFRRLLLVAFLANASTAAAQQPLDTAYTNRIRALTPTDPKWSFTTELVDHLPASASVPTPLATLGYVPGTVGKLSYVADINRYFRAVDAASPRVQVFSLGKSDDGREMLVAAVADEATLARLDDYRAMLARMADPRGITPQERERLLRDAKPIYWFTGSIHSPETGSPEMLMELLYRLAVEETDWIKAIRQNVIVLITPVTEVDGRDRMVDVFKLGRELKLGSRGGSLIYWGKYTAHDNNRDGMVLSQTLTRNIMKGFLYWKPVVFHDLHESVPFLYTSTGTGPYNDEFDPIVVDEWHTLAYQEITELTRRGLPGVWTHGFYDGWTPNYMFAIANFHNAIGRFYETYTSMGADCHTVRLPNDAVERRWDRPNPPVNGVRWCIRTNINYQQSGALIALKYVADHRQQFLENHIAKAERMIAKGRTQAPYAFVVPRGQRHAAEAAELVNLFRFQGSEIHVATSDFQIRKPAPPRRGREAGNAAAPQSESMTVHAGDWIVRLDQPYTQMPRTLLARQTYKPDDPAPYDDTGWTLDELRHVETWKVADSTIFQAPMQPLTADAVVEGASSGTGPTLVVAHQGDWRSAVLPWKVAPAAVQVADSAFTLGGTTYAAGTFILEGATPKAAQAVKALGLTAVATTALQAPRHAVTLPRIALMHTWIETQNEGWVRFAFDHIGVPYTYISDQTLRRPGALDRFDVVVFPHVRGSSASIVNGRQMIGPAVPWKVSTLTPNLNIDQTDDIRPGMGLEGAAALRHFVERGGLLLTEGNASIVPLSLGFNPTVNARDARQLRVRGSVVRAEVVEKTSPIVYGYDRAIFPVYFNQEPLFAVQGGQGGPGGGGQQQLEGVDSSIVAALEAARARVILRFPTQTDSLLVSGLLEHGEEMAGAATVVAAPVGSGYVVMFGIRPFWRWESQGSMALAFNAIANWNHLGPPLRTPEPVAATR